MTVLYLLLAVLSILTIHTHARTAPRRTFSSHPPLPAHLHVQRTQSVSTSHWSLHSIFTTDNTTDINTQGITWDNSTFTTAALADEVTNLPGLIDPINFRHFSGYVNGSADGTKQIHYWLVLSQNDSTSDPLVWWTNGGPGCSGLIGLFEEHGPFRVQPDNSTVFLNPYSWNRRASVIYWEAPVGVGFSYSTKGDAVYSSSGDDQTATDSYYALTQFFERFPQFNTPDLKFYLSGESYGGHYVPQLAQQYINENTAGLYPNITGLLIGNPIIDPATNQYWGTDASYYGHQIVDYVSWQAVLDACINPYNANPYVPSNTSYYTTGTGFVPWHDTACTTADHNINHLVNRLGLDTYGIDYPYCTATERQRETAYYYRQTAGYRTDPPALRDIIGVQQTRGTQVNYTYFESCIDSYTATYLNQPAVMSALHVTLNYTGQLDNNKWLSCGNAVYVGWSTVNVNDYYRYVEQVLQYIFDHAPSISITIFSGDDDTVCPPSGTQQWLNNFQKFGGSENLTVVTPWLRWNQTEEPDEPGGYFQNYNMITFVTAHGAGHEVSFYEPALGYDLFSQWLDGVFSLPNYGVGQSLAYIPTDTPQ